MISIKIFLIMLLVRKTIYVYHQWPRQYNFVVNLVSVAELASFGIRTSACQYWSNVAEITCWLMYHIQFSVLEATDIGFDFIMILSWNKMLYSTLLYDGHRPWFLMLLNDENILYTKFLIIIRGVWIDVLSHKPLCISMIQGCACKVCVTHRLKVK